MGFRGHRGALHLSVLICQRGRVCFGRRLPGGACPLAQSPVGGGAPGLSVSPRLSPDVANTSEGCRSRRPGVRVVTLLTKMPKRPLDEVVREQPCLRSATITAVGERLDVSHRALPRKREGSAPLSWAWFQIPDCLWFSVSL